MAWNMEERKLLIDRIEELNLELSGKRFVSLEKDNQLQLEKTMLLEEYAENMPYFAFSRCPFCEQVASFAFDPFGLNGPWWWKECPVVIPSHRVCEHFEVVLGALDLRGRQPTEATREVIPGPARPFVVNRIMIIKEIKAVLTCLPSRIGDVSYLVTYFSEEPNERKTLHQEWRQDSFPLHDENGEVVASDSKFDTWDFDIKPWMHFEKLLWVNPDDSDFGLQTGVSDSFDDLTGTMEAQIIQYGSIRLVEPPLGQENAMYERV